MKFPKVKGSFAW